WHLKACRKDVVRQVAFSEIILVSTKCINPFGDCNSLIFSERLMEQIFQFVRKMAPDVSPRAL
ncbi:hypothetical protein LZ190_21930, partial [Rhodovulum sulfidophilum]|nr:hypothetical protein [Rhodovulum sulfidophilum]